MQHFVLCMMPLLRKTVPLRLPPGRFRLAIRESNMKNLKISHQLVLLVSALLVGFAAVNYFELRASTNAIYSERYGMLRTQVESGLGILKSFQQREASGELTHEEAEKQAFAAVAAMKFTPDRKSVV